MEVYYGRGTGLDREELVDFLNLVFGFNGYDEGFMQLLPNLYKEEYDPAWHNYVAIEEENGRRRLRAAIGVYPRTFSIAGEEFVSHGIGNVAVHPAARGRGYMQKLLRMAQDDMIGAGADFSDLGGLRHRYRYFGYDKAGCELSFEVTRTNIRHVFPDAPAPAVVFRRVMEEDTALLDDIYSLYEQKPYHTVRPREHLTDILRVRDGSLYAVCRKEDEGFCGFFRGGLEELTLADESLLMDTIRAWLMHHSSVELTVQPYETERIRALYPVCESCRPHTSLQVAVFRFRRLVGALLRLKADTEGLVDGVRAYHIQGIPDGCGGEKEECFTICVEKGLPAVQEGLAEGICPMTLAWREAESCFFGIVSPARQGDPVTAQWFPLPLFADGADHV